MNNKEKMKEITDRIIEQLEQGTIPWTKPWTGTNGAYSRITGKNYSFLNQMWMPAGEYATFNQIRKEGGRVNKGAKGHYVTFWKVKSKEVENKETGEKETKNYPVLREYVVFNIETQTTLDKKWSKEELEKVNGANEIQDLETIKNGYIARAKLDFKELRQDKAYYSPTMDCVRVPLKEQFKGDIEYYETVFHELAHSTGHPSRLNRDINKLAAFGSEDYSREELVAELTSCAIMANTGYETIASFKNNAAYIKSWLNALKNDTGMLTWAAARSEKAFSLIMGVDAPTPPEKKANEKPKKDKPAKKDKKPVKSDNNSLTKKQIKTLETMNKYSTLGNKVWEYKTWDDTATKEITKYMYCDSFKAYFLNENIGLEIGTGLDGKKLHESAINTMLKGTEITVDIDKVKTHIKDNKLKANTKKPIPYVLADNIGVNAVWLKDMLEFFKTDKVTVNGFSTIYVKGDAGDGIICPIRLR